MSSRGISALKLLIVLVFILCLCAAGIWGYRTFNHKTKRLQALKNAALKPEITAFTASMLPDVHARLVKLDHRIFLIDEELKRLESLEKDFPRQKKIVLTEKKDWISTRKHLTKFLSDLESCIETFYVAWQVNPEVGNARMAKEKQKLLMNADGLLGKTNDVEQRLEPPKPDNLLEQLKAKFL